MFRNDIPKSLRLSVNEAILAIYANMRNEDISDQDFRLLVCNIISSNLNSNHLTNHINNHTTSDTALFVFPVEE